MDTMRYFFDNLEWRGWYMIPESLNARWWYTTSIANINRRMELVDLEFSKYKTDHPNMFTFENPKRIEE